jgi:hypothetical protein
MKTGFHVSLWRMVRPFLKAFVTEVLYKIPGAGFWIRWMYRRWYLAAKNGYPLWPFLLRFDWPAWRSSLRDADGPRVLVATSVGAFLPGNVLESVLSVALTLRKARVEVLLCDECLPACLDCHTHWFPKTTDFVNRGPQSRLCASCYPPSKKMYEDLGFHVEGMGKWIRPSDHDELNKIKTRSLADLRGHRDQGLAVGEHALAGALRFFARATLEGEPQGEAVFRRYFEAAFLSARAVRRLLMEKKIDRVVFNHGIYVPQGLIGEAARSLGIPVVNWNPAYRKKCFIFSHGDSYHHTLMSEPISTWNNLVLTPDQERKLDDYLQSRWYGTQDWIWFHENPRFTEEDIRRAIRADPTKPWIGLLTNVLWDAQLHYPANAFPTLLDWLFLTIDYFAGRPDMQLIIRVHPAEIRGTLPSRQRITDELRRRGKPLPPNVFLVGPESPVSTYALMERCDSVLIFGTKTGVELTSRGKPVIVAGEAWIRGKGLTHDARSPSHYRELLDQLPFGKPLPAEQTRLARVYAFHFFFRRMIPFSFMEPRVGDPPFQIPSDFRLEWLRPGADRGLDVVCDGILNGTPFVFPAEV